MKTKHVCVQSVRMYVCLRERETETVCVCVLLFDLRKLMIYI